MADERTLTETAAADSPLGSPNGVAAPAPDLNFDALETVLDVDEVLSQARRVERTAHICLRGDLQAEYDDCIEKLLPLVDDEGRPLNDGERALADVGEAQRLMDRITELRVEMGKAMRRVRFRGLPDDEYREFEKANQDSNGKWKDLEKANAILVSKCAIEPTLTVAQYESMRSSLGATQVAELANKAFAACSTGGVDVPKSLPFSVLQVPNR